MSDEKPYSVSQNESHRNQQYIIRSEERRGTSRDQYMIRSEDCERSRERDPSVYEKSPGSKTKQSLIQTEEDIRLTYKSRQSTEYDLIQSSKVPLSNDKNYNSLKVEKYLNMNERETDPEEVELNYELNDRTYPLPDSYGTESKQHYLDTIQEKSHEASNDVT